MQVYGLLGNPVGHSLSPVIHEAAYDALALDARYVTFEPAEDALAAAVEGARALGIRGLNVTVPFKEAVADHVAADAVADRVGAVNTVDLTGEEPTGHNTDVEGVRRALDRHAVDLDGREAVVVGAGGAGRAATVALADAGAVVRVANRTVPRATRLAEELPAVAGHGLDDLADLVPAADVLVNATTVGMGTDESPVPANLLHPDLAVLDAVYDPLQTRLLRDAAAAGARTIDGAWMLLFQAAAAFERWTGRDAPVEPMNRALRGALED